MPHSNAPITPGGDEPAALNFYNDGIRCEAAGDVRAAASAFLMAFAMAPEHEAFRSAALRYLNLMSGYTSLPQRIVEALERCTDVAQLDLQPLSLVVRNLLEHDPRFTVFAALCAAGDGRALEAAVADSSLAWLLEHRLLRAVLARAVNISGPIETALTQFRRAICLQTAAVSAPAGLLRHARDFFIAIARQCIASRFAWSESEEETQALILLRARSNADALLIRAAYRPLDEISVQDAPGLPPPIHDVWRALAREREITAGLPQLTAVDAGLSAAMQRQYETFPYPRWQDLGRVKPQSLSQILKSQFPAADLPKLPETKLEILSAGCGTGQTALEMAQAVAGCGVMAVDLSRASLAYAVRMAADSGVTNITFGVADILNLAALGKQFHFIECSGVLHHMADPAAGLKVLRGLMAPSGLMRIALYSVRGRTAIVAARAFIAEQGWTDSNRDMRRARQAFLALDQAHPARPVVDSPDFFNLDCLHDLIFNIHERRYTPKDLIDLLDGCGLTVLGVRSSNLAVNAGFMKAFPDPASNADLQCWEDYEMRQPEAFGEMIHVLCRNANEVATR